MRRFRWVGSCQAPCQQATNCPCLCARSTEDATQQRQRDDEADDCDDLEPITHRCLLARVRASNVPISRHLSRHPVGKQASVESLLCRPSPHAPCCQVMTHFSYQKAYRFKPFGLVTLFRHFSRISAPALSLPRRCQSCHFPVIGGYLFTACQALPRLMAGMTCAYAFQRASVPANLPSSTGRLCVLRRALCVPAPVTMVEACTSLPPSSLWASLVPPVRIGYQDRIGSGNAARCVPVGLTAYARAPTCEGITCTPWQFVLYCEHERNAHTGNDYRRSDHLRPSCRSLPNRSMDSDGYRRDL